MRNIEQVNALMGVFIRVHNGMPQRSLHRRPSSCVRMLV